MCCERSAVPRWERFYTYRRRFTPDSLRVRPTGPGMRIMADIDKTERSKDFVRWCQEHGYLPIDGDYVTANTKMRYRCTCKAIREISWKRMNRGETGCQPCSKARGAAKRAYTIEQARERFLEKNLQLLDTTYVNANTPLRYICPVCNVPDKMRLGTVNFGHGCKTCAERIKAVSRRTDITEVRDLFEASGLSLLEDHYFNNSTPMRFLCKSCGHDGVMAFKVVKRGGGCFKCGIAKRTGPGHFRWIEDRKEAKLRKKIIEKCHDSLKHCLMFIYCIKLDKTSDILGYSAQQLRMHLESFPGWDELIKDEWHLDHIYPIIAFIDYGITDVRIINALENLQPLSAMSNWSKAGSYDRDEFENYLFSQGISFKKPCI
jgi:hypothetical protein